MFLRKKNRSKPISKKGCANDITRDTNLDSPPPAKVNTPRAVLDRDPPAERDEPAHLQRLDAIRQAAYPLLRLRRPRVVRPVDVHLRDGRLDRAPRVAREANVEVEDRPRREDLSFFEEGGVGRVRFDGGRVRVRFPDCAAGRGIKELPVGTGWAHVGRQEKDDDRGSGTHIKASKSPRHVPPKCPNIAPLNPFPC